MKLRNNDVSYPNELRDRFPVFVEEELLDLIPVKVDMVFDFGSHARGEALPDADYDLFLLFHSLDPDKIILRRHSKDHEHFMGQAEEWRSQAKSVASGRQTMWWPFKLDDELDEQWRQGHSAKVSTFYVDTESFVSILLRGEIVVETLTAGQVYDPSGFFEEMKGILVEECDEDALIVYLARYANPSKFYNMIDVSDKWDVPRNWAKVMAIGLRRSLAALLLAKTSEFSFRTNYLCNKLTADLDKAEMEVIRTVYGMAFTGEGVLDLESRWRSDKESTLSYMREITEHVLGICLRITDILRPRTENTQLLRRNASPRLIDFLHRRWGRSY